MHARDPFFIDYIFSLHFFIWTSPFNLRQSQLNQCNGFPSHPVTKKLFPQLSPSSYFVNVVAFYPCTPQPSKRENYKYKYCALEIQILCTRNAIQIFVLYYYILGSTLNLYLRFCARAWLWVYWAIEFWAAGGQTSRRQGWKFQNAVEEGEVRQTIKNIEQMLHFKSNRTIQCNCGPIQMFFFLQIRSGWEFGLWQSCAKKTTIDLEAAAASYKSKYKLKIIHYTPHANTVSHWSVEIYNWKYISTPASPLPACWSCDPPPLVFSQLPRAHKPLTKI